jgi:superfamily I DNA and/or RNA helicase
MRYEVVAFETKDDKNWNKIEKQILSEAKIICSTLSMTGCSKFAKLNIDYLIVDEACQSNELETLIALQLNPVKVILVGD